MPAVRQRHPQGTALWDARRRRPPRRAAADHEGACSRELGIDPHPRGARQSRNDAPWILTGRPASGKPGEEVRRVENRRSEEATGFEHSALQPARFAGVVRHGTPGERLRPRRRARLLPEGTSSRRGAGRGRGHPGRRVDRDPCPVRTRGRGRSEGTTASSAPATSPCPSRRRPAPAISMELVGRERQPVSVVPSAGRDRGGRRGHDGPGPSAPRGGSGASSTWNRPFSRRRSWAPAHDSAAPLFDEAPGGEACRRVRARRPVRRPERSRGSSPRRKSPRPSHRRARGGELSEPVWPSIPPATSEAEETVTEETFAETPEEILPTRREAPAERPRRRDPPPARPSARERPNAPGRGTSVASRAGPG